MFPESPSHIPTVLGTVGDMMATGAQTLPRRRSPSKEREAVVVTDEKASC